MNPAFVLRAAAGESFHDYDGRSMLLTLRPGLEPTAIDRFAARLGAPLPPEIRELLEYSQGFDFPPVDRLDFCGRGAFGYPHIFPCGLTLAGDGFGNTWIVDIDPATGEWGPVFFVSHDPPVVVLQSPDVGSFLKELFELGRPRRVSALERVRGNATAAVWRYRDGAIPRADAVRSDDPELKAFAASLGQESEVFDLRVFKEGLGFAIDSAEKTVRRHGALRIFAIEGKPRQKSFWLRFFPG